MRFGSTVLACAVLSGCGRLSFDPSGGANDAGGVGGAGDGPGGSADAMAPVACTAGLILCDSFEQGVGPWNRSTVNGTIDADTTRVHRGTGSIHVHTNPIPSTTATNPGAFLASSQGLPVIGTVHARVWFYIQSPHATGEFDQLINLVDLDGNGISLGTRNGMMTANDYTDIEYAESATTPLPLDRWACMQLSIPSGTTGMTRVFVDDAEVTDVALPKTSAQPAPERIEIGVQWVATVTSWPATDVWFDDVIVDDEPITCAQ